MTVEPKDLRRVSKKVNKMTGEYWHYYLKTTDASPNITGKYLFFADDPKELEKIAIDEIENQGFHHAKINTDENKRGQDYVLCIYYADDSRKNELADRYRNKPGIRYRYWKTDKDTLDGKYSEEFLSKMSPKERKEWTKGRS